MGNKRNLILTIIAMVLLFLIVGVGYKYVVKDYKESGRLEEKLEEINKDSELKVAEDFTVYDKDGKKVKLSDYKGKPVVLNFWASWCGPCQYEMPYFEEAMKKYSSEDVEILMINITDGQRETRESAEEFINENNYEMNIFFDEELNAAQVNNVQGIPRTIFINKDGNITYDYTGIIDEEILNKKIDELIK